MNAPAVTDDRARGWLHSAAVDAVIAFGWLAFYAWLCTTPLVQLGGTPGDKPYRQAFENAALVALAINFIHRHFVWLLFFGDADQRARHPRAVWLAPVVVVVVAAAKLAPAAAFDAVFILLGAWNIWHTVMQRHGIFRAYAAKSSSSSSSSARGPARRDLALVWSLVLLTAGVVIAFDQDTFWGPAKRAWLGIPFVPAHREAQLAILAVGCLAVVVAGAMWLRGELAASVHVRASRWPRWLFLASTIALLGVFALHGPIVGFIVFSVAHSVEYIVFVHVFTRRRAIAHNPPWGVRLLGRRALLVLVSAVLLGAFALAHEVWTVPLFVVYYAATSALHYLYDGLIWKIRRPEVRAQIVDVAASELASDRASELASDLGTVGA